MAIPGVTDRQSFSPIGTIKLGIKLDRGARATDYFVCPEAVTNVYGPNPTRLIITLPDNDPEKIFPTALRMMSLPPTSKTLCICRDGERAERRDPHSGTLTYAPCTFKECHHFQQKKCKPEGCLYFHLPEVPVIGVWQLYTHALTSIGIMSSEIRELARTTGGLINYRYALELEPKMITSPDGRKKVYVPHIRLEESMDNLSRQALEPVEPDYSDPTPQGEQAAATDPECCTNTDCLAYLTKGQISLSVAKFGRPLCPRCQDREMKLEKFYRIAGSKGFDDLTLTTWLMEQFGVQDAHDLDSDYLRSAIDLMEIGR